MSVGISIRSPNKGDPFTITLNKRDLTLDTLKREIANKTQIPANEQVIYLRGTIRLDKYDANSRLENLFVQGTCLWVLQNGKKREEEVQQISIPSIDFPDPPFERDNFYVFCTQCQTYCVKKKNLIF